MPAISCMVRPSMGGDGNVSYYNPGAQCNNIPSDGSYTDVSYWQKVHLSVKDYDGSYIYRRGYFEFHTPLPSGCVVTGSVNLSLTSCCLYGSSVWYEMDEWKQMSASNTFFSTIDTRKTGFATAEDLFNGIAGGTYVGDWPLAVSDCSTPERNTLELNSYAVDSLNSHKRYLHIGAYLQGAWGSAEEIQAFYSNDHWDAMDIPVLDISFTSGNICPVSGYDSDGYVAKVYSENGIGGCAIQTGVDEYTDFSSSSTLLVSSFEFDGNKHDRRTYLYFDISEIPVGATVVGAELSISTIGGGVLTRDICVRGMTSQKGSYADAGALFEAINDGTLYYSGSLTGQEANVVVDLGSSARSRINSNRSWFGVGLHIADDESNPSSTEEKWCWASNEMGWNPQYYRPLLLISYSEGGAITTRRRFSICHS